MWEVKPGKKRGTIRITTLGHKDQPAGWGLSAWHAHGAARARRRELVGGCALRYALALRLESQAGNPAGHFPP